MHREIQHQSYSAAFPRGRTDAVSEPLERGVLFHEEREFPEPLRIFEIDLEEVGEVFVALKGLPHTIKTPVQAPSFELDGLFTQLRRFARYAGICGEPGELTEGDFFDVLLQRVVILQEVLLVLIDERPCFRSETFDLGEVIDLVESFFELINSLLLPRVTHDEVEEEAAEGDGEQNEAGDRHEHGDLRTGAWWLSSAMVIATKHHSVYRRKKQIRLYREARLLITEGPVRCVQSAGMVCSRKNGNGNGVKLGAFGAASDR